MNIEEHLLPYDWRGLHGRLLHLPATGPKKTHLVLVYGQHASIERLQTLAIALQRFGQVWIPDLPGFGGMDSFYKIGLSANVDSYADYLNDFIKSNIGNEPFIIIGMSYGFANVTRLMQKYPQLQKQTKMLVSFVGFTGASDFKITPWLRQAAAYSAAVLTRAPLGAYLFQALLKTPLTGVFYKIDRRRIYKNDPDAKAAAQQIVDQQVLLWRINDCRTHAETSYEFLFKLDLSKEKIPMPVYHLGVSYDHFFDHAVVVKHMEAIFDTVHNYDLGLDNHTPSQNVPPEEILEMIPEELRTIISNA